MEGILHSLGIVGAKLLANIAAFLIFFGILYKFAWKNVGGMLEERRNRIRNELDSIERGQMEIERLKEEYRTKIRAIEAEAQTRIERLENEAREKAQAILDEAFEKAHKSVEGAHRAIELEVEQARRRLVSEISVLVRTAAEKVLERQIDEADNRRFVESFLADLERNKASV